MAAIQFQATITPVKRLRVVVLPKDASTKLPSRGMVMVDGTINGKPFQTALEPDGRGSHWFSVNKLIPELLSGDAVSIGMDTTKQWPEPEVPADIAAGLAADPEAKAIWDDITPMARWDWIRWIRATNNPETRQRHILVACSKMKSGTRRPCCFNRSACTEPSVSKNGVLLEPKETRQAASI